jgi:LCP family protein required for cell wall assembly
MESRLERKKRRKKKKRRFKKFLLFLILILLIGGGVYFLNAYNAIKATAEKMHLNLPGKRTDISNGNKLINILLLGVDERPHDVGRSDTIIVATLNPKDHSMLMTSIPRDSRTEVEGHGLTKINAAYAYGGLPLAKSTVEHFLNIKIDYVAKINMQGLVDLVDAVGGITVDNPIDWYDKGFYKKGYHYRKGEIELNGPKAIGYVRMRHQDPRGDIGRNYRERQVIQGIIDKGKSVTSVTHMQSILKALGDNIKTNLTFDDMKSIAFNYRTVREHIYNYQVQGDPQMIDGGSYIVVSEEEKQKVHNMIQDELNGTLDMSKYQNDGDNSNTRASQ